jgi:lysozyme
MITVMAWQPIAIKLLHQFEGCKLKAYPDPGSKDGHPWTIGWGSTGPGIGPGVVWTQEQADARFEEDLTKFGQQVARLLGDAPTTAHQWAALVSFAYNVGAGDGGLKTSTLLRKHKDGDYEGARKEFARWNKNDGRVMKGLTRRRAAEAAVYATADEV